MKIKIIILIFLLWFINTFAFTNTMVCHIVNEIKIDSSGWVLELTTNLCQDVLNKKTINLDSCLLITNTDTARFKEGIMLDENYLIITLDSLQDKLSIDPSGDNILLHIFEENGTSWFDGCSFGQNGSFPAPLPNQSLSSAGPFYYLDNSPTLGQPNDTINGIGRIKGKVVDKQWNPLVGIKIAYEYSTMMNAALTYSDSMGNFEFTVLATNITLYYNTYVNDDYIYLTVQPDTLINVEIIIDDKTDHIVHDHSSIINNLLISNYPNPFNNLTTISYDIPFDNNYIEINIINIEGKLVKNIFSGLQCSGTHKVIWDAKEFSSGIYFYQFVSNRHSSFHKCLLIK